MNQPHYIKVESGHIQAPHQSKPKIRARSFIINALQFVGLFLFFFALSSLVVMGPTLYSKITYYFFAPEIKETNINLGLPVSAPDYQTIAPQVGIDSQPITQESKIIIPKINVDAPIVFPQSAANKSILDAIQNGVAHYPGTALPGRVGNVFVTGHSSYYWWSGGKYNRIFTLLDKLQPNDLVYVYYEGKEYIYKVRDSIIVLPSQTDVLNPTASATLSLMTCTPVGTNLKRLVVRADLISSPPVDTSKLSEFANIPKIPIFLPL
ncbi:MAG: class E sortase [Patescibacteria group bacterium]